MDTAAIAGHVLNLVLIIGAPALTVLGIWAAMKLREKLHISASILQDEQLQWAVQKGVAYAEEWGKAQATKPTGSAKLDTALKVVDSLADNAAVQAYGRDALEHLVNSVVAEKKAETAMVAGT